MSSATRPTDLDDLPCLCMRCPSFGIYYGQLIYIIDDTAAVVEDDERTTATVQISSVEP